MACRASNWVSTCWGGSTPLRPSVTLTWCQITCFSHKRLRRSVSIWLGPSFYIYWELTSSPMVGKQCPWGGGPSSKTLQRHRGLTRGRHVSPIFTPPSTLRYILNLFYFSPLPLPCLFWLLMVENCNRRSLLPENSLTLHISLERSMLMALMALH